MLNSRDKVDYTLLISVIDLDSTWLFSTDLFNLHV